jgi:hypothetical protein
MGKLVAVFFIVLLVAAVFVLVANPAGSGDCLRQDITQNAQDVQGLVGTFDLGDAMGIADVLQSLPR